MEYIEVGSAPAEEACAQVGQDDYPERSRAECRAFRNLIVRVLGEPPEGASIGIKSFEHDLGTYREVVVYHTDRVGLEYALRVEDGAPGLWDERARAELEAVGFPVKG